MIALIEEGGGGGEGGKEDRLPLFCVSLIGAIEEKIAPFSPLLSSLTTVSIAAIEEMDDGEGEDDHSSSLLSSSFFVVPRKTPFLFHCVAALWEEWERLLSLDFI